MVSHYHGDAPQAPRRGRLLPPAAGGAVLALRGRCLQGHGLRVVPGTPPLPGSPSAAPAAPGLHHIPTYSWRDLLQQPRQHQGHSQQAQVHEAALFAPLLQQSLYWCYIAEASKVMAHEESQELLHSMGPPPQLLQRQDSPLLQQSQYWCFIAKASKIMAHGEFQALLHSLGPPPQLTVLQDPHQRPQVVTREARQAATRAPKVERLTLNLCSSRRQGPQEQGDS